MKAELHVLGMDAAAQRLPMVKHHHGIAMTLSLLQNPMVLKFYLLANQRCWGPAGVAAVIAALSMSCFALLCRGLLYPQPGLDEFRSSHWRYLVFQ
jgi:hypothetical protein